MTKLPITLAVYSSLAGLASAGAPDVRLLPPTREEAPASLIPYPQQVEWLGGWLALGSGQREVPGSAVDGDERGLEQVRKDLEAISAPAGGMLRARYGQVEGAPEGNREAYALSVDDRDILLQAPTTVGLFYAVQTLRQLVQDARVPTCRIVDWPAFPIRGFMHDVGRNFQSVEQLKRQIELAARYKLNLFHWHLTDDPGFRIESRAFPQLNQPESYTPGRDPGAFYTYEQMREVQAFAAERQVEILPEIDIPGHSAYFETALGYGMQSPEGEAALRVILREFMEEFPTRLIHLGADEVRVTNHGLLPGLTRLVREHGREVVMWVPGSELPDGVITHLWMGGQGWEGAQLFAGHAVIDSRPYYLNTTDALQGMSRMFFSQPAGVPEATPERLGAIACAWPDVNIDDEAMVLRIMPIVPGLLTFAERTWRGAAENRIDLGATLPAVGTWEHEAFTLFERDLVRHGERLAPDWYFPYVRHADLTWELYGPVEPDDPVRRQIEADPYAVEGWRGPWQGGTVHLHFWRGYTGPFQGLLGDERVIYVRARWQASQEGPVGLWGQVNGTPFASGRAANPQRGQWSVDGHGAIWINGEPVPAPQWTNPGPQPRPTHVKPKHLQTRAGYEVPFTDEGYWYREPSQAHLKEGENIVLLRVPGRSFTLVPVEADEAGRVRRVPLESRSSL